MGAKETKGVTTIEQEAVVVPDLTIKDLLSSVPAHCFKRSALRSSSYILQDLLLIYIIYRATTTAQAFITPEYIALPHPALYDVAYWCLWIFYGFASGLPATGLWVVAHECGHGGFSDSKFICHSVGWVLHSALGVPYHSWRITHAKHHASSGHMTQDQVHVPRTRSELGLPAFNAEKEDLLGASIADEVKNELWEALGDSPIGATFGFLAPLLFGWPLYIVTNASGQVRYPQGTNHFTPKAVMFAPHQYGSVVISVVGVFLWLAALAGWSYTRGFSEMFRLYGMTYLWVNHWLVLITFLQHTDPLLPHYRSGEHNFVRGALATFDRSLLGDLGSFMGWVGATTTHGISETHVVHHVSSKIPHYNAWEAKACMDKRLAEAGMKLEGRAGGWAEMYRVFKQCKFVEDTGEVLFYKNAYGLAAARPLFPETHVSDSGIEVDEKPTTSS